MSRYDPLRGSLIDDDDKPLVPVITQCEGMKLALDAKGKVTGRVYDPLLKTMKRLHANSGLGPLVGTLMVTPIGMNYNVMASAAHTPAKPDETVNWTGTVTSGTLVPASGSFTSNQAALQIATWNGPNPMGATITINYTCAVHSSTDQKSKTVP